MKKYQAKKRKIIDAEQFLPPQHIPEGVMNVYEAVKGATNVPAVAEKGSGLYTGQVITAQGERVFVRPGEWIVAESSHPGRYYPIANEIFQDLYDLEGKLKVGDFVRAVEDEDATDPGMIVLDHSPESPTYSVKWANDGHLSLREASELAPCSAEAFVQIWFLLHPTKHAER